MRRIIFTLLIGLCVIATAEAQNYAKKLKKANGITVTYRSVYKGKTYPGGMLMTVNGDEVKLESLASDGKVVQPKAKSLRQESFIDYSRRLSFRRAIMPNEEVVYTNSPFEYGEGFTEIKEEKYLGLNCKVVRTSINSNTIDVWYTNDLAFRGTPQAAVGVPDGLVLRVVRNGDSVQEATDIQAVKKPSQLLPSDWGHYLDGSNYTYAINQSGVISVPVFDQQTICFNGAKLPETLESDKVYVGAGGTVVLKKVKLPDNISDRQVFIEAVQYSDGDAYDRTGSIFMIPTDKAQSFIDALRDLKSVPSFHSGDTDYHALVSTDKYDVPLELMRFFTGFGVRKFNYNKVPGQTWTDSVLYKAEVTSVAEQLKGEVWIGAYIGNWDAKGHRLSLKIKYYPDAERKMPKTLPLFNTVNYMEQAGQPYPIFMLNDSLNVSFELKEDVKDARLFYLTTGHGGWGGGDEFNQKPNTIYVDGQKVITFIPWRDDCGTYRNWNPCSGNFSNGLSSSDLSRSNWCPGTMTNPEYIYIGSLKAGKHTLSVKIPQGAPEGGSNSYWCTSGTLMY